MGAKTGIEWCHHTFNPWWGCTKVSPACDNCYAERDSKRYGYGEGGFRFPIWGKDAGRRVFGDGHWREPLAWNRAAEKDGVRRRVFCASMADVMEDRPELAPDRERLYCLIEETPYLEWLLLTKRPQNFRRFLPEEWLQHPRPNVCGMTTVESAACLWRADDLLKTPFATRGLSMEPLLGAVDIQYHVWGQSFDVTDPDYDAPDGSMVGRFQRVGMTWEPVLPAIDWVIVGGESGSGARPTHPEWVRQIRDICVRSRVPFLFKQWGDWAPGECVADSRKHPSCVLFDERWVECSDDWVDEADLGPIMYRVGKKAAGRLLDGRQWCEFPIPVTVTPHGRGPAAKRGGRA